MVALLFRPVLPSSYWCAFAPRLPPKRSRPSMFLRRHSAQRRPHLSPSPSHTQVGEHAEVAAAAAGGDAVATRPARLRNPRRRGEAAARPDLRKYCRHTCKLVRVRKGVGDHEDGVADVAAVRRAADPHEVSRADRGRRERERRRRGARGACADGGCQKCANDNEQSHSWRRYLSASSSAAVVRHIAGRRM